MKKTSHHLLKGLTSTSLAGVVQKKQFRFVMSTAPTTFQLLGNCKVNLLVCKFFSLSSFRFVMSTAPTTLQSLGNCKGKLAGV